MFPVPAARPDGRRPVSLSPSATSFVARASRRLARLARTLDETPGLLPRSLRSGSLDLVPPDDWTSGFFPGSLWLLHELSGVSETAAAARRFTDRLAAVPGMKHTHDLGFMVGCSYGHAWRLQGAESDAAALVEAAESLAERFDPRLGLIRSWDFGEWRFPVIIDNMMNLELLFLAAALAGDARFVEYARAHADRTARTHFREDGSCFHLVDFDPESDRVLRRQTVQGHADDSAWARGQAWAIHGYTTVFRCTREKAYLETARAAARFYLEHPRLPADRVPPWDFDAPSSPPPPRDSSAAAVCASALLELSTFVPAAEGRAYRAFAESTLDALLAPPYFAGDDEADRGFLLRHAVGHLPAGQEIDVPLCYGDFYLLEAVGRRIRLEAGLPPATLVSASPIR
jgi:hypothetical protein